jgi:basic amino acid/polyamine antiporter, APA family
VGFALALVVGAVWRGGVADSGRLWPLVNATAYGVLQSAGFLFFAFAGYARIATLGEEVVDPARTITRAIPIALGITLVVYAVVAVSVLSAAGAEAVAGSHAPLATAVEASGFPRLTPVVRIGATLASLGVLLSLIVGVSRTAFAMASNRDFRAVLAVVHPRYRIPHHAELAIGVVVATVSAIADSSSAIGFSSFAVLTYYAITNVAAWTLDSAERKWPRAFAALGFVGCAALAITLPIASVIGGAVVLAIGGLIYALRAGRRHRER